MKRQVKSDVYHLLHPKLTFLLTSVDKNGRPNVMTCAWATPLSEEPQIVLVAVARESYTSKLIRQTREFVINIPTKKLLKAVWVCGTASGADTDKFKKAGIRTSKSKKVAPPALTDCVGHIECRVIKTVSAGECYAFMGEVLAAYADDRHFVKGGWTSGAEIPLHLGGKKMVYFR